MYQMQNRPIGERIEWIFELARRHGENFRSPEAWLARQRYLAEHPTAIAVLKCMDGRINIPVAPIRPPAFLCHSGTWAACSTWVGLISAKC